jgi:H+-transporting ATPase
MEFAFARGSILKLSNFPRDLVDNYRATAQVFAEKGFRSLGVAAKEDGKDWQLLGILSMFDPPRSDTASTIGEAKDLGISVKMLSKSLVVPSPLLYSQFPLPNWSALLVAGDAVAIAKETCKQLSLGTNIYDSQRLLSGAGGAMAGSDIRDFVEGADGFAEVYPEHKYRVVEMLQQRGMNRLSFKVIDWSMNVGHLTAMTGDVCSSPWIISPFWSFS